MNEIKIDNNEVKNFQFVFSINQKIILEYLLNIGLTTKEINQNEICLISFIVNVSRLNYCKSIFIDNEQYFFIMNNFIINNLIFFRIGSRQIGNMINKLERLGMLKRHIENKNCRYLKVNDFILNGWNITDENFTIIDKLKRFKKNLWQTIENDFGNENEFKLWVSSFDAQENRSGTENLKDVASSLYKYLETCKRNKLKGRPH
ncbi:hypothetical protein [Flavobacterium orientale]|uniref:Uncharacterized protein n=1 Tax=Flavobacterium orientale TaxID=1756020 RepID=A0A916Y389_9FLAO|nr:hypothetical protein [Flavobacterium orientale]GGD28877.1 hypothetical protein GCM10011343_18780 [Flavobacterium orientale]